MILLCRDPDKQQSPNGCYIALCDVTLHEATDIRINRQTRFLIFSLLSDTDVQVMDFEDSTSPINLEKVVDSVDKTKPFKCPLCPSTFTTDLPNGKYPDIHVLRKALEINQVLSE